MNATDITIAVVVVFFFSSLAGGYFLRNVKDWMYVPLMFSWSLLWVVGAYVLFRVGLIGIPSVLSIILIVATPAAILFWFTLKELEKSEKSEEPEKKSIEDRIEKIRDKNKL